MRVQVLSDFGGQQFGRAVHHLQLAETNVVAWHESYLQTRQDRRERRTKSWWQRLLDSTGEEREVSARARPAWQGVAGLTLADSGSRGGRGSRWLACWVSTRSSKGYAVWTTPGPCCVGAGTVAVKQAMCWSAPAVYGRWRSSGVGFACMRWASSAGSKSLTRMATCRGGWTAGVRSCAR